MVDTILQHSHCRMCGNIAEKGSEYCGKSCADRHTALMKKKKTQLYILYAIAFVTMIVCILLFMYQ